MFKNSEVNVSSVVDLNFECRAQNEAFLSCEDASDEFMFEIQDFFCKSRRRYFQCTTTIANLLSKKNIVHWFNVCFVVQKYYDFLICL